MEAVGSPESKARMRAALAVPVERIDAEVPISRTHQSPCRMYHTPTPTSVAINPWPPPTIPPAPKLLPPRKRGQSTTYRNSLRKHHNLNVEKYNKALVTFSDDLDAWERDYGKYLQSLNTNELPLIEEPRGQRGP